MHISIIPVKQNAALHKEASAISHPVEAYAPVSPRMSSLKLLLSHERKYL